MASQLRRGAFVTLEGGEGSGKSSQAEALATLMRENGYEVLATREPAGTELGAIVKGLFERRIELTPEAEMFLFAAARAQHVRALIRPALERGESVLCDRYTDSTLAYQGYGRGLNLDHLRAVNQIATGGLVPHFTLLLDLSPQSGLARKTDEPRSDSLGSESMEFHQRVREGYLELARREPERIAVVDAEPPLQRVTETAWQLLKRFLDRTR